MSEESVIQSIKEDLDYSNTFSKYILSNKGYLLIIHSLISSSIAEEYAKFKLKGLGLMI